MKTFTPSARFVPSPDGSNIVALGLRDALTLTQRYAGSIGKDEPLSFPTLGLCFAEAAMTNEMAAPTKEVHREHSDFEMG